jgi:hypothetical protein
MRMPAYEPTHHGDSEEYDDSPWTREELHALAWEAGKSLGWDDMDEYDDVPEKL